MMSIKTDNLRLNKSLINEQNSEIKTICSKKSSPFSTIVELLHIEKEKISSDELSKIKQKLDDFYDLDCKGDTELRDNLKENSKIKADNSVNKLGEKSDKDEDDYSNIEGLLLTQRKIYSQVCSFTKGSKIEQKGLLHHVSKQNNVDDEIAIKNDLNPKREGNISISEVKKEVSRNYNELNVSVKNDKFNQKIERKNSTDKFLEYVENKNFSNQEKIGNFKNKNLLIREEDKTNTKGSAVIENNKLSEKVNYSDSREVIKNTAAMNVKNENSNIDSLYKEKIKENVSDMLPLSSIKPAYQQMLSEPLSDRKILDIPAFSILYKKVSTLSQPPSITYVFKKWGSELHQIKVNFDIDKKIQLIASTGRVYQSSLENFNQYQGRLSLSLENDNNHWHINAIDPSSENKEDEK
ncbi:hypothetical protein EHE21_16720 [Proteus sp. GOKU]|uniref:hypothetical protein n=1 Tax=Proteus TaxID=583 RepID=UPI001892C494|nr:MULTISPECIES: hypothetical protein [Proteus]QPB80922.1 hypothetical protein EHE21_16720 [Proteus sp. GOKU]QQP26929.1 hypothetical protein D7029_16720 [Proteus vulgaris]